MEYNSSECFEIFSLENYILHWGSENTREHYWEVWEFAGALYISKKEDSPWNIQGQQNMIAMWSVVSDSEQWSTRLNWIDRKTDLIHSRAMLMHLVFWESLPGQSEENIQFNVYTQSQAISSEITSLMDTEHNTNHNMHEGEGKI